MELDRGRLIDHLHLKVRDLAKAKRFYKAVLETLGIPLVEGEGYFFADELWV
ncbi:MAG: VOC family protein, partial [Chloroflexota bacterium]|nr:VOC family protein [Chloroflexota bacterium]